MNSAYFIILKINIGLNKIMFTKINIIFAYFAGFLKVFYTFLLILPSINIYLIFFCNFWLADFCKMLYLCDDCIYFCLSNPLQIDFVFVRFDV